MNFSYQGYRAVIAIDFGTSRSGYAYAFSESENPTECINWPDQTYEYPKTLTQLLYNQNGVVDAWGYTARAKLARATRSEATALDLISNFKMSLYGQKRPRVTAPSGKTYETVTLIADYLRLLKTKALEDIRRRTADSISERDILWCLTVPAIWTDSEKNAMRVAAQQAGLISDRAYDHDRLMIVLEPEAAALYCLRYADISLPSGSRFIVVDCGGGTVDITASEVTSQNRLKEIVQGAGGPFGSIFVDQQFFHYLNSKLDRKIFDAYAREEPADRLILLENWERTKCNFDPRLHDVSFLHLPSKLIRRLEEGAPEILENLSQQQGDDTTIHITRAEMLSMFQPSLDGITQAVEKQFSEMSSHSVDYMFLVGGFSTSPVVQEHLKQKFASRVSGFVVPKSPGAAIVAGAVLYGWKPASVASRIMRRTYGCNTCMIFRNGTDPEAKKRVVNETKTVYCDDRFSVFVDADRAVDINEKVERTYYPLESRQTSAGFKFYVTSNVDPVYVDEPGVEEIGELTVKMPDTRGGTSRSVVVTMYFGQTEINVKARDVTSGQEYETDLVYS